MPRWFKRPEDPKLHLKNKINYTMISLHQFFRGFTAAATSRSFPLSLPEIDFNNLGSLPPVHNDEIESVDDDTGETFEWL
jgi:hypothetical protein